MAQEPSRHLLRGLHQQLRQPGALLLRGKVVHPARGPGVHGPPVRGHGSGLGHQEEPTEQPEQPRQGEGRRRRHAEGQRARVAHQLELSHQTGEERQVEDAKGFRGPEAGVVENKPLRFIWVRRAAGYCHSRKD